MSAVKSGFVVFHSFYRERETDGIPFLIVCNSLET
jgi:hypothetical protein